MEEASPTVVKRIVALLLDSFRPSSGSTDTYLKRCVVLVQTNPLSARKFYQHALGHMTVSHIGQ